MNDEVVFRVSGATATALGRTSMAQQDLQERAHLQEWILANPYVLGAGVEVVTSEFDRWQTATGEMVNDRLDVLGIDVDGRLVVAELKRDAATKVVHTQALNYAAMVSRLTPRDVAELWAKRHAGADGIVDTDAALAQLESEKLMTVSTIRRPRIVLIASDFHATVTATVVWLNEQGVDVSLVRYRLYQSGADVLVSFSQLFPVPLVEDFTVGRRAETVPQAVELGPGQPWDHASLQRLSAEGNAVTIAMLDLCAELDAGPVNVAQIAVAAEVSEAQVRGQLAGLTMRLKNEARYGFTQRVWPTAIQWLPGGFASYSMDPVLAAMWRSIRAAEAN